jgi:anti-sigma regulatory factor (Ser/Thr protein kinase)
MGDDPGLRRLAVTLPRSPEQAVQVRRHIARLCRGLPQELVQVAQLLASELFNNAVNHGRGQVSVAGALSRSLLHVEVADEGPGGPRVRHPPTDSPTGRGLLLVEEIAAAWGVTEATAGAGKTVWFDLNVPTVPRRWS